MALVAVVARVFGHECLACCVNPRSPGLSRLSRLSRLSLSLCTFVDVRACYDSTLCSSLHTPSYRKRVSFLFLLSSSSSSSFVSFKKKTLNDTGKLPRQERQRRRRPFPLRLHHPASPTEAAERQQQLPLGAGAHAQRPRRPTAPPKLHRHVPARHSFLRWYSSRGVWQRRRRW